MSKPLNFAPPGSLTGNAIQISAIGVNNGLANYIEELPPPEVSLPGSTIKSLNLTLNDRFHDARRIGNAWNNLPSIDGTMLFEDVLKPLAEFGTFNDAISLTYPKILESAYAAQQEKDSEKRTQFAGALVGWAKELRGIVAPLHKSISAVGVGTRLQNYENLLTSSAAGFKTAVGSITAEIGKLSADAQSLQAKIAELQNAIKTNNSEVTTTFLNTAGSTLEQGAAMIKGAKKAADGDPGDAILAGVTMGVGIVKGINKLIVLNEQILADMAEIQTLLTKISKDEMAIVQLLNLQTVFLTLGNPGNVSLKIVDDVKGYFEKVTDAAAEIISHPTPWDLIDTVDYSAEGIEAPGVPPWSVTTPVANTNKCFASYLGGYENTWYSSSSKVTLVATVPT